MRLFEDSCQNLPDPLVYLDFPFNAPDWVNIPGIVPEFCLHLSKHLKSLINHCRTESSEEHIQLIKYDLASKLDVQIPIVLTNLYRKEIEHMRSLKKKLN